MAQDNDLFKTTRMALLRGANPNYIAGQAIFLQRDVQGFPKGSHGRIVSIQPGRPGEHRYLLLVGLEKFWAFEADLRPTPPGDAPLASGPDGALSITQRLQSMTLSQRMATLGVDETRRLGGMAATQRMHTLTPEQRMQELLKTNRSQALANAPAPAADDSGGADSAPGAPPGGPTPAAGKT